MSSSALRTRSELVAAQASGVLVRIRRRVESESALGYVVSVGSEFFLVALVADLIVFDGFDATRLQDVSMLDVPAPHAGFIERALRLRGQERPAEPPVDLGDISSLLRSAAAAFPLIAVHREIVDPDICHIGVPESVSGGVLSLKAITPDAEWEEERELLRLEDITRISFGGLYEEALELVAGAE